MSERVPMTPRSNAVLKAELKRLKTTDRLAISKEIGIARDHGDLKENAEYHAAKDKQGLIEARIKFLEDHIGRAEVIDPANLSGDRVMFGATVDLYDVDKDKEVTYVIVGEDEADLPKGWISISSPVARALIGKSVDDTAVVETAKGRREYEIVDVRFLPAE